MNRQTLPTHVSTPTASFVATRRFALRERAPGVGYGRSSGYAATRRYATAPAPRYFRFA